MTVTRTARLPAHGLPGFARSIARGLALGLVLALVLRSGLGQAFVARLSEWLSVIHVAIGPVWIPMFFIALRIAWLSGRALRTRFGQGRFGAAVRPEMLNLAPMFPALGFAGTVWGLTYAFAALEAGEFIDQLRPLMVGLGAAMMSTLVGLGLQILTLLIAAYNPAWSLAEVSQAGERETFALDGAVLGHDDRGLTQLLEALSARQPEALHLRLDPRLPAERRAALHMSVWKRLDGSIPMRPAQPPSELRA